MPSLNPAQLHLALTHLPVVTALIASVTVAIGAIARNPATRRFGLALMVVAGLSAIPTQMSGEGAEEIVQGRPGVSETLIERHEDAAGVALALAVLGGAVAAATLVAGRLERRRAVRALFAVALALSIADTAALAWVAHLGGEIRHDEIRTGGVGGGDPSAAAADDD